MSGSPRKLLRRALDALQQVEEVAARYPEARAELATTLGPDRMARLLEARRSVEAALTALEAERASAHSTASRPLASDSLHRTRNTEPGPDTAP